VIVVSDASPLNYLVLINAVELLPKLFNEVYVPPKVIEELQRPKTPEIVRRWAKSLPDWITVRAPNVQLIFAVRLDPGEVHAISLAKELKPALEALQRTTFRISADVIQAALEADAARKSPVR